ncbi:MAG: hypothetical protein EOP61_31355, partial [Sphingomonadales bacterium]
MTIRITNGLGLSLATVLLLVSCARGEDAKPIDNKIVADNFSEDETINDVDPTTNGTAAALPTDAWVGKWTGVEGLVLD